MSEFKKPDIFRDAEEFRRAESRRGKLFAVLGKPIGHSLSPVMQNGALAEYAKSDPSFFGAEYFSFEVGPGELIEALDFLWERSFCGLNLTIPLKEAAMDAVSELDPTAEKAHACNTLLRTSGGWKAFNTDGFGVKAAVEQSFGRGFAGSDVVILGAGGAARGAAEAVLESGCKSLIVANRDPGRLRKFADDFKMSGGKASAEPLAGIEKKIPQKAIIINATSVGLDKSDPPILDFSKVPGNCVFLDMPYRRDGETSSVLAARKNSIPAENGLAMLAWQGAKSLSLWTGKPLLGSLMLEILKKHLYGHS